MGLGDQVPRSVERGSDFKAEGGIIHGNLAKQPPQKAPSHRSIRGILPSTIISRIGRGQCNALNKVNEVAMLWASKQVYKTQPQETPSQV